MLGVLIPHESVIVGANVEPANIVSPNNQNIRFLIRQNISEDMRLSSYINMSQVTSAKAHTLRRCGTPFSGFEFVSYDYNFLNV